MVLPAHTLPSSEAERMVGPVEYLQVTITFQIWETSNGRELCNTFNARLQPFQSNYSDADSVTSSANSLLPSPVRLTIQFSRADGYINAPCPSNVGRCLSWRLYLLPPPRDGVHRSWPSLKKEEEEAEKSSFLIVASGKRSRLIKAELCRWKSSHFLTKKRILKFQFNLMSFMQLDKIQILTMTKICVCFNAKI